MNLPPGRDVDAHSLDWGTKQAFIDSLTALHLNETNYNNPLTRDAWDGLGQSYVQWGWVEPSAVGARDDASVGLDLRVQSPFPQTPGGPKVWFAVDEAGSYGAEIVDVVGRRLGYVDFGRLEAGSYSKRLSCFDAPASRGAYFLKLMGGGRSTVRKMICR